MSSAASHTRPIRGVVFDLDGTLGETLPVCFAAFRVVLERDHGEVYDDDAIHAMFGPSERGVFEQNATGDPDELVAEYLVEYETAHDVAKRPFPGICETLNLLDRRQVPMAVVTGKGYECAMISLRRWGVAERFTHVMAGGDDGDVKVDNMRSVVAAWGLDGADIVAIGDMAFDAVRARRAGLRPLSAAWSDSADYEKLVAARPERVFRSVAAFRDWLAAATGGGS